MMTTEKLLRARLLCSDQEMNPLKDTTPPTSYPTSILNVRPSSLVGQPPACLLVTSTVLGSDVEQFHREELRAHHLQKALAGGYGANLLRDLTKAINRLINGDVPLVFAPYLGGASLFALDKSKNGVFDVRPIESGEILRRLVSKCLCAS